MSRASSQRQEFPRNFGFKAMVDVVHIGHSTTNPTKAENTTGLGVSSGDRPEKISKMNFLKVAVKMRTREGKGIHFSPFRECKSRLDDHQMKSETHVQAVTQQSVTPYSEARESVHRIRFGETQLDQLPTLERGHVRNIVAVLEEKLATVQSTEQKRGVKEVTADDIRNVIEHLVGHREDEQESMDTKEPRDVMQSIRSFRPLHFSGTIPNPKGIRSLQKPVAVVQPAGDLCIGQKTIMDAGSKARSEGDVTAAILPHRFEKGVPDVNIGEEAATNHVPFETQMNGSDSDVKMIGVEKNPREPQRHGRRLYIMKRDRKGEPLNEGESNKVGDTIEIAQPFADGIVMQGETIDEGSEKLKATGTEVTAGATPGNNTCETNQMARAVELDYEPLQHPAVADHMMSVTAGQDASHADEEQISTTESARIDRRNRRRKERLLGLLEPSFHRA